jgi:hypothetical protein
MYFFPVEVDVVDLDQLFGVRLFRRGGGSVTRGWGVGVGAGRRGGRGLFHFVGVLVVNNFIIGYFGVIYRRVIVSSNGGLLFGGVQVGVATVIAETFIYYPLSLILKGLLFLAFFICSSVFIDIPLLLIR